MALAVDDSLNFDASQQAKEALRASEERLRLIVDNIPGLAGTRTATGEPEFVNRQMLGFFGQSLEQLPDWSSLPARNAMRLRQFGAAAWRKQTAATLRA